ncbi:MAG: hypothetical protein VX938_08715, partial [Myxococcota bacterium]|nr:hypothetical protein [Myxococcota bacterium]
MLVCWLTGCQAGTEAGHLDLVFQWPEGQAPDVTKVDLCAWGQIEEIQGDGASVAVSLAPPTALTATGGADLLFTGLEYEVPLRVLIFIGEHPGGSSECTESDNLYYIGETPATLADAFVLKAGVTTQVEVPFELVFAPGRDEPPGRPGPPSDASTVDLCTATDHCRCADGTAPPCKASTPMVSSTVVNLQVRVSHADTVTVSNNPSFTKDSQGQGVESRSLPDASPSP